MIWCIAVIILAIAADQISKFLVSEHLAQIGTLPIIEDIFHFTYVENRGAAFGMLSEHRWVFMTLSIVGIVALIVWLTLDKPKSRWLRTAVSLVIGGGIGNMIDRIFLGYVIDFLDCRFIDFYVFNIADSCVCVGCTMFLVSVIVSEMKESKAKKALEKAGSVDDGADEENESDEK